MESDRRHPSRPRRGGNARALRGADPDAHREGRRVPPPLGQGLLLGDGGGRGNRDRPPRPEGRGASPPPPPCSPFLLPSRPPAEEGGGNHPPPHPADRPRGPGPPPSPRDTEST